mmetsp:Transcript_4204/g.8732  ORF Transcript_4204/g.8732 Transcript_4204/m.8732 type:complete len:230 (-) Transcript_4204:424-1113(-)
MCIWMDSWASWISSVDKAGVLVAIVVLSFASAFCGFNWFLSRSCFSNRALCLDFHSSFRACQSREANPSSQVSMTRIPARVETIRPSRFPSALSVARSSFACFSNFHRRCSSNTKLTFWVFASVVSWSVWSSFLVLVRACWRAVWRIVLFPVTALSCSSLSCSFCCSLTHLACHSSAAALAARRAADEADVVAEALTVVDAVDVFEPLLFFARLSPADRLVLRLPLDAD